MKMLSFRGKFVVVVVVAASALAFAGTSARRRSAGRCDLDGVAIVPTYRVRLVDLHGASHSFCCIRCATLWLESRKESVHAAFVADEPSGEEIDAAEATFVRSTVITTATTGNRTHAFRDRRDAQRHAAEAFGRILSASESPFSRP